MTTTDYVLDLALIGLVFLQIRGRRLTMRALVLPIIIVAWAASKYLRGIPTAGNDLMLLLGCAALGAILGAGCGIFTTVRADDQGVPVAKAGALAATLWVLGVGARFAFQEYAAHGGAPAIARFSVAHSITSSEAWVAALLLMAVCEALMRTGILAWRGYAVRQSTGVPLRAQVRSQV